MSEEDDPLELNEKKPSKLRPVRWTLETAVEFIRELEPHLAKVGWHCALTGSVIYKGESRKDLDIVVYPHRTSTTPYGTYAMGLRAAGCELFMTEEQVKAQWRSKTPSQDEKHVEVWFKGARRVDVFVLS